jgi:hypothetical protein
MTKKVTNSKVSNEYLEMLKEKFSEKKQLQDTAEVGGDHNSKNLSKYIISAQSSM